MHQHGLNSKYYPVFKVLGTLGHLVFSVVSFFCCAVFLEREVPHIMFRFRFWCIVYPNLGLFGSKDTMTLRYCIPVGYQLGLYQGIINIVFARRVSCYQHKTEILW